MQLSAKCENDQYESFKHDSLQTTKGEWPLKKICPFHLHYLCGVEERRADAASEGQCRHSNKTDVTNVVRNADYM